MTKIISVTPPSKDFGKQSLDTQTTQNFTIASTGSEVPTITGARIVNDETDSYRVLDIPEGKLPLHVAPLAKWQVKTSSLPPRAGFGWTKLGNYIIVVGGERYGTLYNDCWRSPDGISWERLSAACFDKGRSHLALFAIGTRLIAVGGITESGVTDEIWTSDDGGVSWSKSATSLSTPLARMGYAQYGIDCRMYGGIDNIEHYDEPMALYWSSQNGINWATEDCESTVGALLDCSLCFVTGNYSGWYLFGGHDGNEAKTNLWTYSGSDFIPVQSPVVDGLCGAAMLTGVAAIVISGGTYAVDDMATSKGKLYVSLNGGSSWETAFTFGKTYCYHALVLVGTDKVVLFGGKGCFLPT